MSSKEGQGERIKAFCVDFNWDRVGRFSSPGLYAHADPVAHLDWYEQLGVNTVQSFNVTHNGYAWYRSDIAPRTPGDGARFSERLASLTQDRGMRFMGYFSPGANLWWHFTRPALSRDISNAPHIPFTREYIDFFSSLLVESLERVPMDGLMLDWLWNPEPMWTPVERELYAEVMDERFPSATPNATATSEYGRRAVSRLWSSVRESLSSVGATPLIWLSCNDLTHPQIAASQTLTDVDWLMNESPNQQPLLELTATQEHPQLIQCVFGGFAPYPAAELIEQTSTQVGLYGFARPDEISTLPALEDKAAQTDIRALRAAFMAG